MPIIKENSKLKDNLINFYKKKKKKNNKKIKKNFIKIKKKKKTHY